MSRAAIPPFASTLSRLPDTRVGWIWINPYVTLISAYERLIRGRGHEIGPDIATSPDLAHAAPEEVIHPDPQEGNDNSAN